jgi:hypothetical protein
MAQRAKTAMLTMNSILAASLAERCARLLQAGGA